MWVMRLLLRSKVCMPIMMSFRLPQGALPLGLNAPLGRVKNYNWSVNGTSSDWVNLKELAVMFVATGNVGW
ncbi:hypothetical protein SRDD_22560 [Serratia sp. DD3]|nr:hypothetical protein SRDD_22560 [Serratia sp. DD3]